MNDIIDTKYIDGYTVNILQDESPESPRTWGGFGKIIQKTDYDIGETVVNGLLEYLIQEFDILEIENYSLSEKEEKKAQKWIDENLILLPIFMYDHSGITIKTSPFNCPWDESKIGLIYVSKEKVKKEYDWKCITKKREKFILDILNSEIKILDCYCTGQVYGYSIENSQGEIIDSCYGFYGDYEESGMQESYEDSIKWDIEKARKAKQEKTKTMIKNHVPLLNR